MIITKLSSHTHTHTHTHTQTMDREILEEVLKMVLEIINSCLTHNLHNNSHLIYSLLYQREIFEPYRTHPTLMDLVQNIETVRECVVVCHSVSWSGITQACFSGVHVQVYTYLTLTLSRREIVTLCNT